ncbi:MAG: hypothetical protein A2Y95_07015 [Deltaproteobacteria bacterium RBG_13_65_10]|jgi:hypothetical protein|nr:MAG: hypothetical protein A2Y95_07015 [Deltaproteobacteria bacterium RBG_13_65_10]
MVQWDDTQCPLPYASPTHAIRPPLRGSAAAMPSIKESVFSGVAEDVKKLLAHRGVSHEGVGRGRLSTVVFQSRLEEPKSR